MKLYWRIEGFDSTKPIFEARVPLGCFTEKQIRRLLQALVAKTGLTYGEIVGAYAKGRTSISNNLLHVQTKSYATYVCGSNPHFAARVVDENGKGVECSSSESEGKYANPHPFES